MFFVISAYHSMDTAPNFIIVVSDKATVIHVPRSTLYEEEDATCESHLFLGKNNNNIKKQYVIAIPWIIRRRYDPYRRVE